MTYLMQLTPGNQLHSAEVKPHIADTVALLTEGLGSDLAEVRNYRRLLENTLSALEEARQELVDANHRIAILENEARTDTITGLLNRRGFEISLKVALARSRRFGDTGVLVIMDLDGFKEINDTYGHQTGDLVLAAVGNCLSRNVRDFDSVARIGGDEFALILTNTNPDEITGKLQNLENILNWMSVPWQGEAIPVRASFGFVTYGPTHTPQSLYEEADKAMYARKNGR